MFAALTILVSIPHPAAAQVIVGRVVDAASGSGVPRARVSAVGTDGDVARRATTGADGRFTLTLRDSGSVRVQVTRAGYDEGGVGPLVVGPRDTVTVEVRLTAPAVPLKALEVTTRRRRLQVAGVFRQIIGRDSVRVPLGITGRPRGIYAQGTVPTPSACYRLAGAADRTGQVVTLNVQARPTGEPCPESPEAFSYKVTVRGLPRGTYTFRLIHSYRNGAWPPEMFVDTTVTVP